MARFTGKTVLVTGAAGGFGRRTAERLAAEGANLVLADRRADALAAVAATVSGAATLVGDVTDPAHHAGLVALARSRFGGLDIAVNNAGIVNRPAPLHEIDDDEAERVIAVDLIAVFHALKAQLAAMTARFAATGERGAIVNVASVAGLSGAPSLSIYAAAKHGVVGLTRSAALDYAARGVRVNAVCPSYARTEMALALLAGDPSGPQAAEARLTRGVPMRRLAEVDEVVEAILFAADPANGFMTGQAIAVDGGIGAL